MKVLVGRLHFADFPPVVPWVFCVSGAFFTVDVVTLGVGPATTALVETCLEYTHCLHSTNTI